MTASELRHELSHLRRKRWCCIDRQQGTRQTMSVALPAPDQHDDIIVIGAYAPTELWPPDGLDQLRHCADCITESFITESKPD